MKTVTIGNKVIGRQDYTFVIAEAGINHNGDIKLAKEMVKAAKQAGADAVKFQSFKADKICDKDLEEVKKVEGVTGGTKSSYEMYKSLELSKEDHLILQETAKEAGILFSSSVFDGETASFLDDLGVPFFKISSGDITYLPLIEHVAQLKKPVIISTGMSTVPEIFEAVETINKQGNEEVIILHCNANYPPPLKEVNLNNIVTMKSIFDQPIGFSDHTEGIAISLGAVGLGAAVIEKHFTLDNNLAGPDQPLSLNPADLKQMVDGIREINKAKGSYKKFPTAEELPNIFPGRRSIMAGQNIKKGEKISLDKLKIIKPAKGIPPKFLGWVVGKKAKADIKKYEPVTWENI